MRRVIFATTVEAAVATARRELGDDALLVDAKPAFGEDGGPGGYEVLFELDSQQDAGQACENSASALRGASLTGKNFAELRDELARLSSLVACLASSTTGCASRPGLTRMTALLQTFDLPPEYARQILNRVEQRLGSDDRETFLHQILAEELRTSVSFDAGVEPKLRKTVIALVGPPGVGKTTMLVKLAMRFGVSARRPALLLSTDTYRVAAADQLRTYAGVLGLPFQVIESPRGLSSALVEHGQKELIFIDTPGFSPRDWESAGEWVEMLDANPQVQIHLVLPATMRASDLRELVRRWSIFRPDHLIFTRIDETAAYGGCVAAALESDKPLSWLSTGQDIPEDLEKASADRLFGALLGHKFNVMAAVA